MAKPLLVVTILVCVTLISGKPAVASKCPYGRPQTAYKNEVFGFLLGSNSTLWEKLAWDQLTTLAIFMNYIPDSLICLAHQHQVRVVKAIVPKGSMLENSTACQEYITKYVNQVKERNMDGLNIDFEEAISTQEPTKNRQLINFVANFSKALHQAVPGSKLSFDFFPTPDGIAERNYDYLALSKSLDCIVLMAYGMSLFGPYAKANSDYNTVQFGAQRYIDIGVPESKIIIALPWYGFSIPCSYISPNHVCSITVGIEDYDRVHYKDMDQYYEKYATTSVLWDKTALSPYFDAEVNGELRQVRFDNQRSLRLKNRIALKLGLLGVGMWTVNYAPINLWQDLWDTVPYIKNQVLHTK